MNKFSIPFAAILTLSVGSLAAQTSGNLTAERWDNLPASFSLSTLQKDGIANRAADMSTLLPGAEWSPYQGDNYGLRLRGTVTAPFTGTYTFFVAGDDHTALFLSPDTSRFNKQRIAWHHSWTDVNQWEAEQLFFCKSD